MPDFPPEAFAEVFSAPELPTVIGGQAVYHWAERFFDKAPELALFGPFVSRDGDLWATRNKYSHRPARPNGMALQAL
jgi:hypothetical protein